MFGRVHQPSGRWCANRGERKCQTKAAKAAAASKIEKLASKVERTKTSVHPAAEKAEAGRAPGPGARKADPVAPPARAVAAIERVEVFKMASGQGRERPDDPVGNGNGVRHSDEQDPRKPLPGSDEENADEELDDDEEDEISPREPEPDEEDPDLPARE